MEIIADLDLEPIDEEDLIYKAHNIPFSYKFKKWRLFRNLNLWH